MNKNKDFAAYIKTLQSKKQTLEFSLAEVNDEIEYYKNLLDQQEKNISKGRCNTCNGAGEYWDFWGGNIPCPDCR